MISLFSKTGLVLLAILAVLAAASLAAYMIRRHKPGPDADELWARCTSWWWMILVTALAIWAGKPGVLLLFSFVSYLALQEFLSIVPSRAEDRPIILAALLIIPLNALLIWFERYGIFLIFIPVYAFVVMPFLMVLAGQVHRFLAFMGTLHWGMVLTVYNLGYVAYLAVPPAGLSVAEGAGLVLSLLLLTEANDVAQYITGKTLRGPKIVPRVSPGKTWAGFGGGMVCTTALAAMVLPFLTEVPVPLAVFVGLVMGVAGFAGDVVMSAIKRDLGLKDTSALIPGHGGILDRIDSLTFTAPLFFHILAFFHFSNAA